MVRCIALWWCGVASRASWRLYRICTTGTGTDRRHSRLRTTSIPPRYGREDTLTTLLPFPPRMLGVAGGALGRVQGCAIPAGRFHSALRGAHCRLHRRHAVRWLRGGPLDERLRERASDDAEW